MKRIVVYTSAADDMTSQQHGALHVNVPAPVRRTERNDLLSLSLPSTPSSLSLLPLPPGLVQLRRLYKIVKMRDGQQEEGKTNES